MLYGCQEGDVSTRQGHVVALRNLKFSNAIIQPEKVLL
jgi:hypothetical protein